MRRPKNLTFLLPLLCFGILLLTTSLAATQQVRPKLPNEPTSTIDFSHFPLADFNSKEPVEPLARSLREAKGRKYQKKYTAPISEKTDQIFAIMDWDVGLPALPVSRSAAIVIGRITKAEAHLTPDKTDIYSEFSIYIDVVAKNDQENALDVGRTLTVQRSGGRVKMPSGKVVVSWTNHQDMPRVGGRYVLFLTHDFETKGDMGKDFYILTGYELKDGRVFPLDNAGTSHPMTVYKGASESTFLNDLFSSVAQASRSSN